MAHRLRASLWAVIAASAGVWAAQTHAQEAESEPVPAAPAEQPASQAPVPSDREVSSASRVEEIVVTARRREESAQDVPISITAFTAGELGSRSVVSIQETFDAASNVTYEYSGYNTSSRVYIRGVGNAGAHFLTGDPTVALYVDGVYQARAATGIFDLLDVERIEVLRGPQGTLFGRNTTGGAIQVITRAPIESFQGYGEFQAGNDHFFSTRLTVNVPLLDNLHARGSFGWSQRDGYTKNRVDGSDWNDHHNFSGRLALRFEPIEALRLDLTGHFTAIHQNAPLLRCSWDPSPTATVPALLAAFGVLNQFIADCNAADQAGARFGYSNLSSGRNNTDFGGTTFTATWKTRWGTLTSVSAWQRIDEVRNTEADGSAFPYFDVIGIPHAQNQYSEEIRFSSTAFDERFHYVAGFYWFLEEAGLDQEFCLLPVGSPFLPPGVTIAQVIDSCSLRKQDLDGRSLAGFAEGTFDITDQFSISVGVRRTYEKKEFRAFVRNTFSGTLVQDEDGSREYNAWTPRASISYEPTEDLMLYVSWSKGYKSGSFNGANPLGSFKPEILKMWEAGGKSDWFDKRLRLNLTYFHGDYDDLQLLVTRAAPGGGFITTFTNAADATVQGIELELETTPLEGVTLSGGFGWTDARYDEFFNINPGTGQVLDLSDNEFPSTPRYNYYLSAEYAFPVRSWGTLRARVDWSDRSKTYMEIDNIEELAQRSRGLLNARLGFELADGRTEISLWGKNLTDETYIAWGQTTRDSLGYNARFEGPPRWYGAEIRYRFGD